MGSDHRTAPSRQVRVSSRNPTKRPQLPLQPGQFSTHRSAIPPSVRGVFWRTLGESDTRASFRLNTSHSLESPQVGRWVPAAVEAENRISPLQTMQGKRLRSGLWRWSAGLGCSLRSGTQSQSMARVFFSTAVWRVSTRSFTSSVAKQPAQVRGQTFPRLRIT